ncbi:amidase [Alkalihalobacillus sp. CinArs1]|uniref:amidase n=1 Tax=Alkalihalobacillus sp. CinArs1 TaxID=2995314 RepID=UPI0022DD27D8|nr:amidase [Alkalihalobacillus sp. CinArs1]
MSLVDLDAVSLSKKIASREVSSSQVVKTYIDQLKSINPTLNCLVEDRFDKALEEAKLADYTLATKKAEGRLFGVPISVKECFHVEGMYTTGGLSYRTTHREKQDAHVVKRLKDEGAIILGKSNTPQLCFCQETDNKHYGRTNNPWDITRTAGGSSGGEASLIAAGGAAVGIGSDIGGSIRIPAHFNGVIGFKSGNRQVSHEGTFPFVHIREQERMLGIGAISKSVRDARLINQIISDERSETSSLDEFKLVFPTPHHRIPINRETFQLLSSIRDTFTEEIDTEQNNPPFFNEAALLWQQIMSIDGGASLAKLMSEDGSAVPIAEYMKEKFFKTSSVHSYLSWALIGAKLFKPNRKQTDNIIMMITRGEDLIQEYLDRRILVLPVYHTPAPLHGELYQEIFSIRRTFLNYMPYVAYANVWGLPSLVVPIGTSKEEGLPIGVQLVSRNGNEEALFQMGEKLEEKFGGYRRCDAFDQHLNEEAEAELV